MYKKLILPLLLLTPVNTLLCAQQESMQELPYRLPDRFEGIESMLGEKSSIEIEKKLDKELAKRSVAKALELCFSIINAEAKSAAGEKLTKPFVFERLHHYLKKKSSAEIDAPAIIEACRLNNPDMLKLLLEKGANSNVIDFAKPSTVLTTFIDLPLRKIDIDDDPLAPKNFLELLTLLLSKASPEVVAFINEHFSLCTLLARVIVHCSSEEQAKAYIELFKAKGFQQNPALENKELITRTRFSGKILPLLEKTLGAPVIIGRDDQEKLSLIKKLLEEITVEDTRLKTSAQEKITYILQSGFNVNTADKYGNRLLHYLAHKQEYQFESTEFDAAEEAAREQEEINKMEREVYEAKKDIFNLLKIFPKTK